MSEILKKDAKFLYSSTLRNTKKLLDPYTSTSLSEPELNSLINTEKNISLNLPAKLNPWKIEINFDLIEFSEIKEPLDEKKYHKYLSELSNFASFFRAEAYNLAADSFLYSLYLDYEQIYSIEESICLRHEKAWVTIKEEIILKTNDTFKNKGSYEVMLSAADILPAIICIPESYRNRRLITLEAMVMHIVKKITQATEHRLSSNLALFDPNKEDNHIPPFKPLTVPITKLDLFLNIYDYDEIFNWLGFGDEMDCIFKRLKELQEQGLTIYRHKSIKSGCFAIIEKGTFSLQNLSSIFDSSKPNSKFDFYRDITALKLSFGIGYYGYGNNACPPLDCPGGINLSDFPKTVKTVRLCWSLTRGFEYFRKKFKAIKNTPKT